MKRIALAGVGVIAAWALIGGGSAGARGGATVKAENFDFSPKTIHVSPGEKVKWKGISGEHTVTFKDGFDEVLSSGGKVTRKFGSSGTFKYVCRFHKTQGMKGKVVVD